MSELLIELFCEEIPAMMQKKAEEGYRDIFSNYFEDIGIAFEVINIFISPRRLTVYANGIPDKLPSKLIELKGPRIDAPVSSIEGFCKSNNIAQDQLFIQEIKNQKFYVYLNELSAQSTASLLEATLAQPISEYVWPKSMYWGDYKIKWVRPLHNIMCIFDSKIIPFRYGHLTANNFSFGHRFMAPSRFEVVNFQDYKKKLQSNFIILERKERLEYIKLELQKAADQLELNINNDPELLEEVVGLVEYPKVIVGEINKKFLLVPSEVLICSMRTNQKYFSLFDQNDNFAPYFLFVSNIDSINPSIVIKGNEKVLAARLSDALYFYTQDLNIKLKERLPSLEKVVFHAKLGSLREKVERLVQICSIFFNNHQAAVAANLCKSDIVTEVVGEFPSLQGVMGYHYAKAEGFSREISTAIGGHYKPQGPLDDVPSGIISILAISDKIDSLCGLVLAGQKPSGSKDPYALRRQALGIMRIILENKIEVNISNLVQFTCDLFRDKVYFDKTAINEIVSFLEERAKYYFKDQYGYNITLINAVLDLNIESNLLLANLKLSALQDFLLSKAGDSLLIAYKRVSNILGSQEYIGEINRSILSSKYECNLLKFIDENELKIQEYLYKKNYKKSLKLLASVQGPIASFFDNIMVKDEDQQLSNSRLLLLKKIKQIFDNIAKFELL